MIMVADVPVNIEESQPTSDDAFDFSNQCGQDVLPAKSTETPVVCDDNKFTDNKCTPGCVQRSLLSTQDSIASVFKQKNASGVPGSLLAKKLQIFSLNEQIYSSQMVGIKRMTEEKIREEEEATEGLQWPETVDDFLPHTNSLTGGSGRMTNVDYTFNMHGHIVGMALCNDYATMYLYVNRRSWPDEYVIEDVMDTEPPLISEDVDIHVIDLVTFTQVDTVFRSHKAYSPNDECFCLFLDVNDLYVASGAEDNQGYMWDRYYGVHVRCFPHDDAVNSCAFNPMDPEMLVTASDDNKIKIWRSRRQVLELNQRQ